MVLVVVVPFLNESEHLPSLLRSIEGQRRPPDLLILVDDGSTDGSFELAQDFAALHPYARAVQRPPRPPQSDRLATAAELRAFQHGVELIDHPYDVVAKLDADLDLRPSHFETMVAAFECDPSLGLTGGYLSVRRPDGTTMRESHPPDHIRGPNKFYRRECLEQMSPVPAHLGWDTMDEVMARMHGWRTESRELSDGDSIHLRPTGLYDGRLRAFWRWGECAYGYGSHPYQVLAATASRARRRPYGLSGVAYLLGWAAAHARRRPRARAEVRSFRRREELRRLRRGLSGARAAKAPH